MLATCPQCLGPFSPIRKPLLFPCGHSCCEACLSTQVWKHAMRNKTYGESKSTTNEAAESRALVEAAIRKRQIEESEGVKCAICVQPSHKISVSQFPPNYSLQEILSPTSFNLSSKNNLIPLLLEHNLTDESLSSQAEKYVLETFAEMKRRNRAASRLALIDSTSDSQVAQINSGTTSALPQTSREFIPKCSRVKSLSRTLMQHPFLHPFHLHKRECPPKITMLLWLLFQIQFNYSISAQLFDTVCLPLFIIFIFQTKVVQLLPVVLSLVTSLFTVILIAGSSYSLSSIPFMVVFTCILSTLLPPNIILSFSLHSLTIRYCGIHVPFMAQYLCFLVLYILASMPNRQFLEQKTLHFLSMEEILAEILSPIATFLGALSHAQQSKVKRSVSIQTDSSKLARGDPNSVEMLKSSEEAVYLNEPCDQQPFPSLHKPAIPQSPITFSGPHALTSEGKPKNWRIKFNQLKAKFAKSG